MGRLDGRSLDQGRAERHDHDLQLPGRRGRRLRHGRHRHLPDQRHPRQRISRAANGPAGLAGIPIDGPESLTNANATQGNGSPFSWKNLPFGDYTMAVGNLAPPDGYEIVKVQMTPNGANPGDGFTLSEANPTANIVVFLVATGSSGTPVAG